MPGFVKISNPSNNDSTSNLGGLGRRQTYYLKKNEVTLEDLKHGLAISAGLAKKIMERFRKDDEPMYVAASLDNDKVVVMSDLVDGENHLVLYANKNGNQSVHSLKDIVVDKHIKEVVDLEESTGVHKKRAGHVLVTGKETQVNKKRAFKIAFAPERIVAEVKKTIGTLGAWTKKHAVKTSIYLLNKYKNERLLDE